MENQNHEKRAPHVLVFPLPAQGHINSMLRLANLLSLAGVTVTFLNTHHNHHLLLRNGGLVDRPDLRFLSITDGLPSDHPRSAGNLVELLYSLKCHTKVALRDMLLADRRLGAAEEVKCVIGDGSMSYVMEVAEELEIQFIAFRTISACSFWAYFSIPWLIQSGELPFSDDETNLDKPIKGVPGMESFLRQRDLPSFCRAEQLTDPLLQFVSIETSKTPQASALILNTFEPIESPVLAHIKAHHPNLYTLGPLHSLLQAAQLTNSTNSARIHSTSSLWKEDPTCTTWLDAQPPNSVLYVSFGSYTVLTRAQLLEFWHGLIRSQKRFLWVMRPGLVNENWAPEELAGPTRERGLLVEWAPQEKVLAHWAVGGFLTHSGWNSTLESMAAGVPMICWPFFADQQTNSRFVSHVWRVGLDMKDTCDRWIVERMVRELMDERTEEFKRNAAEIKEHAERSVSKGGSSCLNFQRLVRDLKAMPISH